jgi:D-3-phosphoglycerate dehydrogenase / 2-oxoglutarate reductase
MRVVVLDDYADAFRQTRAAARLAGHEVAPLREREPDPGRLASRIGGAEALVLTQQRSVLPRALVERLPRLRLVCQTGRYLAHVDVAACTERGVLVCAGPTGGASTATAELTWALVLAAMRRVPEEAARLQAGGWQRTVGTALAGRTLGVYGYGRIGGQVARYGRAFGMRVLAFGREGSLARARADGFEVAAGREAFFAEPDVLSLHVALTPETRGLVTAADLARMKPTALLVNTARARLVEEGALAAALKAGRPGFAAVDVFEEEPAPADHPLLALPNALCTPHLGYAERDSYEALYAPVVEQILAFASGARPAGVVNPEALA